MNKYYYNTTVWLKKFALSFSLMVIGVILILYIPVENEFSALLLSLCFICGFILMIFDTVPVIFRCIKSRSKKLLLDGDYLIIINDKARKELRIERESIIRVSFKGQSGKYEISREAGLEEIDDRINKIIGRRLVIETEQRNLIIYLELLDNYFLPDFIKWYQENGSTDLNKGG